MKIDLFNGDCLDVLKTLPDNSVDSIVTDPPYGLNFMGKKWDYDVPSIEIWEECLRVLKPGGHLLAFSGTRTYHRMVVRIEDAGFEIRDMISWIYGSGFPKSLNVDKAIKKIEENNNNVYNGFGTSLKPSNEPIVMARKPLSEKTVAENVLKWGTGGINIDGCRIIAKDGVPKFTHRQEDSVNAYGNGKNGSNRTGEIDTNTGRFPANLILSYPEDEHDENGNLLPNPEKDEVLKGFPYSKSGVAIQRNGGGQKIGGNGIYSGSKGLTRKDQGYDDEGSASRFFYCAKTSKKDRDEGLEGFQNKQISNLPMRAKDGDKKGVGADGTATDRVTEGKNVHPTVKPTNLCQYLVRLVTPPNGVCLDPFMGSGSTGKACKIEGFGFIGIEREKEYFDIAKARIDFVKKERKLF